MMHAYCRFYCIIVAILYVSLLADFTVLSFLITAMLGAKYGVNKSVYNVQINAVAQMLEAKLIKRVKVGVYEFGEPQKPLHKVTEDLWRESYFINEPLANREDTESVIFEPYFRYLIFE